MNKEDVINAIESMVHNATRIPREIGISFAVRHSVWEATAEALRSTNGWGDIERAIVIAVKQGN